jgi:hypothetical protein
LPRLPCRSREAERLFARFTSMSSLRIPVLLGVTLLCACIGPPPPSLGLAGGPPSFATFGEDEDACRHVGAAAIKAASYGEIHSDALTARSYDQAYQRCMFEHGRARQIAQMPGARNTDGPPGNVHSFEYPDAFYHIPYATPGYGYDGYSY